MRLRKAIVWSFTVLAVIVVALLIILLTVDLNPYRSQIEARASAALDRPVSIGGDLSLGVSLLPTLVVEELSIANPAWASRPNFAHVERLEVQVPLFSLLRGGLSPLHIEIDGADVLLEQGPEGENNWTFKEGGEAGGAPDIESLTVRRSLLRYRSRDNVTQQLVLSEADAAISADYELEVEGEGAYNAVPFTLSFSGGVSASPGAAAGQEWSFSSSLDIADTSFMLQGAVPKPFALQGLMLLADIQGQRVDSLESLFEVSLPATGPYQLSARMTIDDRGYQVTDVKGSINDLGPLHRLSVTGGQAALAKEESIKVSLEGSLAQVPFSVNFTGGSLNDLLASSQVWPVQLTAQAAEAVMDINGVMTGTDEGKEFDLQLALHGQRPSALAPVLGKTLSSLDPISLTAELKKTRDVYSVSRLKAQLGTTVFAGQVNLQTDAPRPRLTGKLTSQTLNIKDFVGPEDGPVDATTERAWLDDPIPLDWLQAVDADIALEIQQVVGGPAVIRDLRFTTKLGNGRVVLEPFRVSVARMTIQGGLELDAAKETPILVFNGRINRIDVGRLLKALALPQAVGGQIGNVRVNFTGEGRTARALLEQARAKLTTGPANLAFRAAPEDAPMEIAFTSSAVSAAKGQAAELTLNGTFRTAPVTLRLRGGTLAELVKDPQPWPRIGMDLHSRVSELPLHVSGKIGTLGNVLAGENIAIDLVIKLADARGQLNGTLADARKLTGTGALSASGPNFATLRALLGIPAAPSEPFQASARLKASERDIRLENLALKVGASDLSGPVAMTRGERPKLTADLSSQLLDLTAFVKREQETTDRDSGSSKKDTLFPAQSFPLAPLRRMDAAMNLQAQYVRLGDIGVDKYTIALNLKDGHLDAETKSGARFSTRLRLQPRGDRWTASIQHNSRMKLDWLLEDDKLADLEDHASVKVDVSLTGTGSSVQSMMGSSNGTIKLVIGKGLIRQRGLRAMTVGVFNELLNTVNPLSNDQRYTSLNCAVLYLEVKDGIATSTKGVAMQTENINMVGSGAINFKTEEIQLHFRTAQRRGVGISIAGLVNPFIMVGGTLSEPRITANKRGVMTSGTAAWATGGLTLLFSGVFRRVSADADPCATVLSGITDG